MKHIKLFKESDEQKLLGDLEILGVNPETFTMDDIEDAFYSSDFDPSAFKDGTYMEIDLDNDFSFDMDETSGSETYVTVTWNGGFGKSDVNSSAIRDEIFHYLKRSEGEVGDKRYTHDQIEEAIDSIRWEDYIEIDTSDIEVDVESTDRGNQVEIEGKVDNDYIEVEIDTDGIWKEMKSYLESL